jgi:hypothetical protein
MDFSIPLIIITSWSGWLPGMSFLQINQMILLLEPARIGRLLYMCICDQVRVVVNVKGLLNSTLMTLSPSSLSFSSFLRPLNIVIDGKVGYS